MRLLIFSMVLAILGSCNMNSAQKESKEMKNFESVQTVKNLKAQVKERAGIYFLQIITDGAEVRYVPMNLRDDLKVLNSWVEVSGEVGSLAADTKALGFPMKITEISEIEDIYEARGEEIIEEEDIIEGTESTQMKQGQGDQRKLVAKESIEYAGSKLTVNRAVTHEKGILVSRDGTTWLIEQYKNGQVYNRLLPVNLAKEFMEKGMQVEFDGHIGNPPPNVRLMGSPIHIEYMAKYKGEDLKAKTKTASPEDKGDSKFD